MLDAYDVVVVGAGLAGCSTALHLAERRPDLRVALLEAGTVADGASGRGTGLLGPRFGPAVDVARRRDGDEVARARYWQSETAVRRVIDLAQAHAPATLTPCGGQLVVGFTAKEEATVRARAAAYAALGLPVSLVPAGPCATPAGPGAVALRYLLGAGVDPAGLTRGLAAAACGAGVRLLEHTPVRRLDPAGNGGTWVISDHGRIRSRAVVVTVDAAAPNLRLGDGDHPLGGQLVLQVCATMTAPLPADLLAALGGPGAPHVLSAAALGAYRRITPDGRIVLGGGPVEIAEVSPDRLDAAARSAATWHRQWLDAMHPDLVEVPVERTWRGQISLTRDGLPVVRRLPGSGEVWSAGGWNGHGLAATVAAGAWLADRVLDGAEESRPAWFGSGRGWPLAHPLLRPAVRVALAAERPRCRRGRTRPGSVSVTNARRERYR